MSRTLPVPTVSEASPDRVLAATPPKKAASILRAVSRATPAPTSGWPPASRSRPPGGDHQEAGDLGRGDDQLVGREVGDGDLGPFGHTCGRGVGRNLRDAVRRAGESDDRRDQSSGSRRRPGQEIFDSLGAGEVRRWKWSGTLLLAPKRSAPVLMGRPLGPQTLRCAAGAQCWSGTRSQIGDAGPVGDDHAMSEPTHASAKNAPERPT